MGGEAGAVTQNVAKGRQDVYLTNEPNITFWKGSWQRYTNFALENQVLDFESGNSTGKNATSQVRLHRSGDLVYHMYVVIDLPGIANVSTQAQPLKEKDDRLWELVTAEESDTLDSLGDKIKDAGYLSISETNENNITRNGDSVKHQGVPYWTQAVGQYLINDITLSIGSQPIDQIYGEYMFMYEELHGKPGRRLTEMIGKSSEPDEAKRIAELRRKSRFFRRLYVPIPFFCSKTSGLALPLVSLQFHDVKVKINWNSVRDAIVESSGIGAGDFKYTETTGNTPTSVNFHTVVRPGQAVRDDNNFRNGALALFGNGEKNTYGTPLNPITDKDVSCALEIMYVYLDVMERSKFAEGTFEILMDEVQQLPSTMDTRNSTVSMQMNFNHAVIEVWWAARQKLMEQRKQWFNYGGVTDPMTKEVQDPVQEVDLRLNNQSRFAACEGRYFRLVQPYQHHTCVPSEFIYCYSFALHPEDTQPSGSCNFSRIDNSELRLKLDQYMWSDNSQYGGKNLSSGQASGGDKPIVEGGNSVTVVCYARNWNILRITLGLAGKQFAN